MHGVAKTVDHIEDGICLGNCLPDLWEHRYRIEYSPQICEGRQNKVWDDGDPIETIGQESIQESDEREEK